MLGVVVLQWQNDTDPQLELMVYAGTAAYAKLQNQLEEPGYRYSNGCWWVNEYPVTKLACEAKITENTACTIYQWFREMCSTHLLNTQIILGGPGIIVQVDESQFKHKPKVY